MAGLQDLVLELKIPFLLFPLLLFFNSLIPSYTLLFDIHYFSLPQSVEIPHNYLHDVISLCRSNFFLFFFCSQARLFATIIDVIDLFLHELKVMDCSEQLSDRRG